MKPFDRSQGKPQISFDDFAKLDLQVGEVVEAKEVEGREKLLEIKVDFGDEVRTIYAGIGKWYTPESLVGRKLIFVTNLEPKKFKIGEKEYVSEGMMMAAGEETATLYVFDQDLPNGTVLR